MKKRNLLIVAMLFIITVVSAQESSKRESNFHLGNVQNK